MAPLTTCKTFWLDLLFALILVIGVFSCFAVRSLLPVYGVTVVLTFTLVAVFSQTVRRHWITRRIRAALARAVLITMLLALAGAVLVIYIPLSRTQAIGVDGYWLRYLVDEGPRRPAITGVGGRNIEWHFDVRWAGSPFRTFVFPNGWFTASGNWIEQSLVGVVPPVFVFAVPTALLWALRIKRFRRGYCRNCDYDLTGNTSGRCPECGEPTPNIGGNKGIAIP